jgi:nanoRNase/pAp phosphatase (c-di-AMP/oligoRNAs hydrolase)
VDAISKLPLTQRLDLLRTALQGASSVLILPHNDPDPDAIASAVALRHLLSQKLGIDTRIVYKGIIGRAENRALVRYLDHPLDRLKRSDLLRAIPVALVDTQPGAGNSALPATYAPVIVFDHHPRREPTDRAIFTDVQPELGSTSTMLTQYLQAAGIEPSPQLATALFYGIKTDTMGLVRGASPADVDAYFFLQPHIDIDALIDIEAAQVPAEYFSQLHGALEAARVYNSVVVSYIGVMNRPDLAAEMADLLSRLKGTQWVVCLGAYNDDLILAIRTRSQSGGAGHLAQQIVEDQGTAGGHGVMAGGQVKLQGRNPESVASHLVARVLKSLNIRPETVGKPLIH